jgi:hypothetical protein
MDYLARFIREHYLQLEEKESTPVSPGSGFQIERHLENTQVLTLERRERCIKALRREIEARGLPLPRFFQPFDGAVILQDGEPHWGRFWINGNFYADEGAVSRARRMRSSARTMQLCKKTPVAVAIRSPKRRLTRRFSPQILPHLAIRWSRRSPLQVSDTKSRRKGARR